MKQKAVVEAVEVIKALRTELHGSVESSVIDRLDRIIRDLERLHSEESEQSNTQMILDAVGTAIEIAGLVATVYQLMSNG